MAGIYITIRLLVSLPMLPDWITVKYFVEYNLLFSYGGAATELTNTENGLQIGDAGSSRL